MVKTTTRTRLEELRSLLDAVRQGKYDEEPVHPDSLVVDQAIYPRTSLDMSRVGQMAEALEDGQKFPPILLASDRKTVIDGAHRTFAYRQKDFLQCPAVVLPIVVRRDVIALSMMSNSPSGGLPLRREDITRSVDLLFKELKGDGTGPELAEQIKNFAGSLNTLSQAFGVSYYRLQQHFQRREGNGTTQAPARGSMPARSKGERQPEGPWEAPTLPQGAVKDVLAAPATAPGSLALSSPWDFVSRGVLRVLVALSDLHKSEDWKGGLLDSLGKLTEEERTFLATEGPSLLRELAGILDGD